MKTLLENEFISILFDEEKSILLSRWKPASEMMESGQMLELLQKFADLARQHRPACFLANDSMSKYMYTIQEQALVAQQILGALLGAGVKKFALILPEDFFVEMATEQTLEEAGEIPFQQMTLRSEEDALKWFAQ